MTPGDYLDIAVAGYVAAGIATLWTVRGRSMAVTLVAWPWALAAQIAKAFTGEYPKWGPPA